MATIINNPPTQNGDHHDEYEGSFGFIAGIIIVVLLIVLFFWYGLPRLRGSNSNNSPAQIQTSVQTQNPPVQSY